MQQTFQLNFFKITLMTGLLLMGGQSFSQVSNVQDSPSTYDTEQPAAKQGGPSDEENHDTKDLEKLLKRYNTDQEKVLNDSSKINKIQDETGTSEVDDKAIEEMRPSDNPMDKAQQNAFKKVRNDIQNKLDQKKKDSNEFSENVRKALEPMQKLSEAELLKRLDDSTKDSKMRPYMDQFPNITIFAVKLIKDTESIPALAKILENKDRLIKFGGIMLCTVIFGFFLKRLMHREGRSFIKSAFYFLIRMYLMFAIRVFIVYYFFAPELTPAAKIFKQTFMKG